MIIKRTETERWIKLNKKKTKQQQQQNKQTTKLDMKNIYSWCH